MKGWKDLGSDVNWSDYGGRWGKRAVDGSWYVLDFTNMWEACGNEAKDDGCSQYVCEVKRVDLSQLSTKTLKSAYDCIGLDLERDVMPAYREAAQVEACIAYGCAQPLESFSGNVYAGRIRADARRYAETCMKDAELLTARLARPVNAIGSTAEEYGRGDLDAALLRGPFDATKKLMLKIHGVPQEAIDELAKGSI